MIRKFNVCLNPLLTLSLFTVSHPFPTLAIPTNTASASALNGASWKVSFPCSLRHQPSFPLLSNLNSPADPNRFTACSQLPWFPPRTPIPTKRPNATPQPRCLRHNLRPRLLRSLAPPPTYPVSELALRTRWLSVQCSRRYCRRACDTDVY